MSRIAEEAAKRSGRYRAVFATIPLGRLAAPPEIRTSYRTVSVPIRDAANAVNLGQVESSPRLEGEASLHLSATAAVWDWLASAQWRTGELRLEPETPGNGVTLRFPVARPEPRWEFEPAAAGPHGVCIHLRLRADSSGKLFYRA